MYMYMYILPFCLPLPSLPLFLPSSSTQPVEDPCLPASLQDSVTLSDKILTLRGTGKFDSCRTALWPVLKGNASTVCTDRTCKVSHPFKKPPVKFTNLEFFGTSEFFYTMRDTLRISGRYSGTDFNKSARVSIGGLYSLDPGPLWGADTMFFPPPHNQPRPRLGCHAIILWGGLCASSTVVSVCLSLSHFRSTARLTGVCWRNASGKSSTLMLTCTG